MDCWQPLARTFARAFAVAFCAITLCGPLNSTPQATTAAGETQNNGDLTTVTAIRHWSSSDTTHVVIDLERKVKFKFGRLYDPDRVYFDLYDIQLAPVVLLKRFTGNDGFLSNIRIAPTESGATRIALDLNRSVDYTADLVPDPYRLEITLRKHSATAQKKPGDPPEDKANVSSTIAPGRVIAPRIQPDYEDVHAASTLPINSAAAQRAMSGAHQAKPAANGGRSLVRVLGLKIGRIVIDAGHGGDDYGTIGLTSVREKDVVLDVAMRLGRLLQNLGAEVSYTRIGDRFLPLEARTAIANREQADLFISIHANSNPDRSASGVETYYLNFTNAPEALEVAARENTVSQRSVSQLRDLVQKIAQQDKRDESRELAASVQRSLGDELPKVRSRGVKEAPFIVLTGASMPAVLTEIAFVSNPEDENKLKDPAYRQAIALAIYDGISEYISGLSGISPATHPSRASASEDPAPQTASWVDSVLNFVADNRVFVVVGLLLVGLWSFFVLDPTSRFANRVFSTSQQPLTTDAANGQASQESDPDSTAPKLKIVGGS